MKTLSYLFLLSLLFTFACGEQPTTIEIPARTISDSLALLTPAINSVNTIGLSDTLKFVWRKPTDISNITRYRVVLDTDSDFTNGSVLRVETLGDTSLALPYSRLNELSAFTSSQRSKLLNYTVFVASGNFELRSKDIFPITITLNP
ncbi:MAG: hypothetical protein IAF08_16810 [Rhizobacter sp.]|nr:hypothetical protein [Chlorobiales bacterium]